MLNFWLDLKWVVLSLSTVVVVAAIRVRVLMWVPGCEGDLCD